MMMNLNPKKRGIWSIFLSSLYYKLHSTILLCLGCRCVFLLTPTTHFLNLWWLFDFWWGKDEELQSFYYYVFRIKIIYIWDKGYLYICLSQKFKIILFFFESNFFFWKKSPSIYKSYIKFCLNFCYYILKMNILH